MASSTLRKFLLLLYKNYLVRRRQWKSALIVQILIPLLLFHSIRNIRKAVSNPPQKVDNQTYPLQSKDDISYYDYVTQLYVVPDNDFTRILANDVLNCLQIESKTLFRSEKEMLRAYEISNQKHSTLAMVFDENVDSSTSELKYKLMTHDMIPDLAYSTDIRFSTRITRLQMCLDSSLIKTKHADFDSSYIFTQRMPTPEHEEQNDLAIVMVYVLGSVSLTTFLIQLLYETSKASDEKFLGVNVLMAMNGVPNYLNLLSWLASGLIFSLFYTIPILILLNMSSDNDVPILYNGNSFIFWLVFTLHAAHLFSFGMHLSSYFTRSKFLIIGLLIIYLATSSYTISLKKNFYPLVPYVGIIFPNLLLYRACEVVTFYQTTSIGIGWNNLFSVDNSAFGVLGSLGGIIILSILGTIIHFTLANYICAINPGRYGAKKHLLYFLDYFKKSDNMSYGKVDNYENSDSNGQPFEPVSEGTYVPGIQLRNLKKIYNVGLCGNAKVHALKGISIDFYQGQITSLLGHNGAGKTTMMSILTGMISPSEGEVLVNGKNIREDFDEIISDMGLCPQENIVFPNLSVIEQFTFFAKLKNNSNKLNSTIESDVKSLLETLKLYEKRDVMPKNLSGGQKRRVCLGMALAGDSNILILDEPTSGLDPEIRRSIWDILLKIRGQKTVLISTHDMEEADVLGDRIAIVHSGKLRSYGTTMFLKKLIGRGNVEVTLSTEYWCRPENIRNQLGYQSEIINTDGNKIVLSIPNTPDLPDSLDRIEINKKDLGITGMSVSLITLEQVFLKVTKDSEDDTDNREPLLGTYNKLDKSKLWLQAAKGLLRKKATYTLKNISTTLIMIALIVVSLFMMPPIFRLADSLTEKPEPVEITLSSYENPRTYYKTDNNTRNFGISYAAVTQHYGSSAIEIEDNQNFNDVFMTYGLQHYTDYATYVATAAQFSQSKYIALYNGEKMSYSMPISLNLLANALLKSFTKLDYNIKMSVQQFPFKVIQNSTDLPNEYMLRVESYIVSFILVILLYPAIALLIIHPLRETMTNIKHLQKMTGLSWINYWGTMFLFDMAVMLVLTVIIVLGFIIIDKSNDLHLMTTEATLIMCMLLLLFSANALPILYSFTFCLKSVGSALKLFCLAPMGLIIAELIMILFDLAPNKFSLVQTIRPLQKVLFSMTPYVSFLYGEISTLETAMRIGACKKISLTMNVNEICQLIKFCCDMKCNKGICEKPEEFFHDYNSRQSLKTATIYLCLTPILYFAILWVLECKIIPMLLARVRAETPEDDSDADEQVRKVKRDIASEISLIKSNPGGTFPNVRNVENMENGVTNHIFLVYELRKKYGNLVAVKDITFGVDQSECFGLLGVNGAGKSTTFRMMTGEEIPVNGTMFLNGQELSGFFGSRSQMGYCPQNDALIGSLNSYDHLRLFARLRGIPEHEVENEVRKWIKKLNLNACASQPSGTYSGGNKRRLNIAISMIGIPDVVLLDEPTTGVDPGARRSLWNVIQSSQKTTGQALILTSHSMEECEVLCGRLAIMVGGKFVCIGPCQQLKQRFGTGYDIQVKLHPEKAKMEIDAIKRDIMASLEGQVTDENAGYLMYHVSAMPVTWRRMYDVMSSIKNKYSSIEDFAVLSSTLEQLFLFFARSNNKSY